MPTKVLDGITVSPQVLNEGDSFTIAYKYSGTSGYRPKYVCNGVTVNLSASMVMTNQTYTVAYEDIVTACSLDTSNRYSITFSGVGDPVVCTIGTGIMAFSLYDDGEGDVGATFGTRCLEGGKFTVTNMIPYIPMSNLIRIQEVDVAVSVGKSTSKTCSSSYVVDEGYTPIAVLNKRTVSGTNRPDLVYLSEYLALSTSASGDVVCEVKMYARNQNTTSTATDNVKVQVLEIYTGDSANGISLMSLNDEIDEV